MSEKDEIKEVEEPKAPPTYLEYAKEFVNGNTSASQAYATIAIAEELRRLNELLAKMTEPNLEVALNVFDIGRD